MSGADVPDVPEELLAGLEPRAREGRAALVRELLAGGVALDAIRSATAQGRLALLPVQEALRGNPVLTTDELSERSDVDRQLVDRMFVSAGLPIPSAHEVAWEEGDVVLPGMLDALSDAGVGDAVMLELSRALGEASARIGAALLGGLGGALANEGDTELELAHRASEVAALVQDHLGDVLALIVRLHTRAQLEDVTLTDERIASGTLADASEITIGFADVVGFTKLGEERGAAALTDVAAGLADRAAQAIHERGGGVRIVKTIGDAVMLSGARPADVLGAVLALQEIVAADDDFPAVRAGVTTGEAVAHGGDWFGPAVNRAARACAAARPGTVLTDQATRDAVGEDDEGVSWNGIGRVRLHGLGRVALHRARRPRTGTRRP